MLRGENNILKCNFATFDHLVVFLSQNYLCVDTTIGSDQNFSYEVFHQKATLLKNMSTL